MALPVVELILELIRRSVRPTVALRAVATGFGCRVLVVDLVVRIPVLILRSFVVVVATCILQALFLNLLELLLGAIVVILLLVVCTPLLFIALDFFA